MNTTRKLALGMGLARVVYDVALWAAPGKVARNWVGEGASSPSSSVGLRGLAGRDAIISTAIAVAALSDAPLRPWLIASVASDFVDIAATLTNASGLPDGSAPAATAVAGLAAASGIALALADDA